MDIQQVQRFTGKAQEVMFQEQEPMFKAWLIQSVDTNYVYLVTKYLHCCSDGLDILQVYAQMQDTKEAREKLAVRKPKRSTSSFLAMLLYLPFSIFSLAKLWYCEYYRHLSFLKDHANGVLTKKRDYALSGDIMLEDVAKKAKAFNVGVHEYILAAISVAIYKVTDGRETSKVNFVCPNSTAEPETNLETFTPKNAIVVTFCTIRAKPTMREAIEEAKLAVARYREPRYMTFWMFAQDFMNHMGSDWAINWLSEFFSQHMYQFCISNMVAQRNLGKWVIGGQAVEWVSVMGSEAALSISVTTYNDTMKVCVCADRGYSRLSRPMAQ